MDQPLLSYEINPLEQFEKWYEEAVAAAIQRPDAMTLATSSSTGSPSARIVLFKGVRQGRFTFFTNYQSHKGEELAENPRAALLFYWSPLYRQVRVEGRVERTSATESDDYWGSRPHESQLSAMASAQSEVVGSREELEGAVAALRAQFQDREVPRPPHWGGYTVTPNQIEFWQGQPNRLHDRICYTANGDRWEIVRLAP